MDTQTPAEETNPRAVIGGNNPPKSAVFLRVEEIIAVANKWITERPTITEQEIADKAGAFVRQSTTAQNELNKARLEATLPLRQQVDAINKEHDDLGSTLKRLTGIILERLNAFATAQRLEQERIAREAREAAEKAAAEAAEAKRKEAELLAQAESGAAKGGFANVASSIAESREAEQRAKQLEAEAKAAEKAKPKFGGEHFTEGSRRSLTQRKVETPVVSSPGDVLRAVITANGGSVPDGVRDALLTAARAYKREKGKWPKGITIETGTKVQ